MIKRKTIKLFAIFTVTSVVAVFLCMQATAVSQPGIRQGELIDANVAMNSGQYTSPILTAEYNFNLVGLAWQGGADLTAQLRFSNKNGWSEWFTPESMDYIEKDGWRYLTEPILADQADQVQYQAQTNGDIKKVKLVYLAPTGDFSKFNIFSLIFKNASAAVTITKRTGWQADESWRLDSSGKEVWPAEYRWPEKIVVHHTAGDEGNADPKATLRGIYYWHAVVLGWGDIGYNYVIDQLGNVYEGRFGGDAVIGAHAYRSKTCAVQRFGGAQYEANFNRGTIGIAVLGNYETVSQLNDTVRTALTDLISQKAKDFGILPSGSSYFIDNTYPNIAGHKDVDCTDCPGKNLYSQLDIIRTEAQAKYEALGGVSEQIIKASFIGQSEQPLAINVGEEKEVWADFRNDGNVTWRNYQTNTLSVVAQNQTSSFYAASWNSPTEAAKLTTPNVAPGDIGRFVFNIKAPSDKLEVNENFALQFNGQALADTTFIVRAQISGLPWAAALEKQNIKPAVFLKTRQSVTMQFRNRGLQTWKKGDVKLNIYDLNDQPSRFNDSWPKSTGQFNFAEPEVKTNELATFTFTWKSPDAPGLYRNIFRLADGQDIVQNELSFITRVDSTYQASLVSQNIPAAVLSAWRLPVVVKFKNTGLATWDRNVTLKAYDLGNKVSAFKDKTWLDNYTVARLSEKTIKSGQTGTFTFRFKSPANPGLYRNDFRLMRGNSSIQNGEFSLVTRVDK